MNYETFFAMLWQDYIDIAPQAQKIHDLFTSLGEAVINDHVAFRTFSDCPIDLEHLQPVILAMGYKLQEHYHFEQKKLVARSYSHPDPAAPRIFVSELMRHLLSEKSQRILESVVSQIDPGAVDGPEVFARGLLWQPITAADYDTLSEESEYAAWLTSLGLRVNHFTVSLNHLKSITDMQQVIDLLQQHQFPINQAGGAIKGVPADLLVQSSTMADQTEMTFSCGQTRTVPTCFYEFAMRYKNAGGELFDGFIASNADKIFESTHRT
ncbi:protein of unknown function [Amphritea atlantica]|uniref:2-oxoadipate dioxygenase/decarboxylase n=1 Tax=Amphritea atlantica TaxID=355243 RepID=A0A1H9DBI0_9GAMM|nr:DUF1338 domain-containing protein [Amphritea atlantica]SEQ10824.1 protein of unknown function [Amphritea atlantica]